MEKIDLGVASRVVDVKHLESSTKRIISRTWKDEKDKREMKQMVTQMAKYINAIHNPNPQPLSQIPVSFDSKCLANQKMLDQVQRNRVVMEMFNKWMDLIIQQGSEYINNLVKVYKDAEILSKELEPEIVAWEKERVKWVAVLAQMNDVQKYGLVKFLAEKPVENLDDNVLYVLKKNVEWCNSIIGQGHEESTKLLRGLTNLIDTIHKDLKCIDIQLMKEGAKVIEEVADMIKVFQDRVHSIQITKSLTTDDFLKATRIESMLIVYSDHLEVHKARVMQVNMDTEVWKQRIIHIGLPYLQVILNFSIAHLEW